jgi:hypothetical protein
MLPIARIVVQISSHCGAADDPAELQQLRQRQHGPQQVHPADPEDPRGDLGVAGERGLAGRDGPARKLDLDRHLHQGADDHQPEQHEPGLRTERGGGDQLAGPDDRGAEDEAWAEVADAAPPADGRLLDAVRGERVRVGPVDSDRLLGGHRRPLGSVI